MSYIGNTPTQQNFVAGADQFSGNGSTVAFTLSRSVNTVFDIFVTVANVPQDPFTAYTVSGNTLTFDGAPPSGTNNIDVVYRATNVQTFVPSPGVSTQLGLGSASAPSLTFIGDTNTGIYSPAADQVAVAAGGTQKALFGTGSATIDGLTVGRGAGAVATNTAVGNNALPANTTGSQNSAFGTGALFANTTGSSNSGLGRDTLQANTTGSFNTAAGTAALYSNTTASENTAVGYQSAYSNTTGSPNSALGYQSLYANTTGIRNTAIGYKALVASTTGSENTANGHGALFSNTTGANNTAIGSQSLLSNTTASNNTAVGYQAGYSNTTGTRNTFVGYRAGYSITTEQYGCFFGWQAGINATGLGNTLFGDNSGSALTTGKGNTFIGSNNDVGGAAGGAITTGSYNTILGSYSGNQGGLDITTDSNNIVISDGSGVPYLHYDYISSTSNRFVIKSTNTSGSTNTTFIVNNASGSDIICEASNNTVPAISGSIRISKNASNNRSINASGTVNQNGADYAEYMAKAGDFAIAKGDICGINAEGKLTNVFSDALSFVVKSTDPGLVGGDSWFTEPRPLDHKGREVSSDTAEYAEWFARMEAARAAVDRIAFCGQVPVNVLGAVAGQYIIPVNDNGAIKGEAVSNPTFEQYQIAVGKVIAIEEDGRAKIIVKVA